MKSASKKPREVLRVWRMLLMRPILAVQMCAGSPVAAATVDAGPERGNTRAHECTAEQHVVVVALEGVGGWLICS